MQDDRSFREMMNRYNRELMMMQQKQPGRQAMAQGEKQPQQRPAFPVQQTAGTRDKSQPAPPPPPVTEKAHSQTIGDRGPVLLQDTVLHETLETFVHSNMMERVVHAKGCGAFGQFQPYQSMAAHTRAAFLQDPAQKIPVLVRFSLAAGTRGTPDAARNIRGFATRFYTKAGNFDIVGNHIPVFFVRDAIRFPETIAALSPSPVSNLPEPDKFWSFIADHPEAVHMLTWLYSDAGTVPSYRQMRGFGINTFVWINAAGVRSYVKYHWIPLAGERTLDRQEAAKVACKDPDSGARDLFTALARGERVDYELCVQLMNPADEQKLPYDPLDDTKVWDEAQYPLLKVGKMTLDRNPENYGAQVEQAAFSPANLVDGIELSADKMLQGRSFIYWDAQRRRLGPGFRSIPVNQSPGWSPDRLVSSGDGEMVAGAIGRSEIAKPDNFTQAGERYRALSEEQRAHLADNIAAELYLVPQSVQERVIGYLREADAGLGDMVAQLTESYAAQASTQPN